MRSMPSEHRILASASNCPYLLLSALIPHSGRDNVIPSRSRFSAHSIPETHRTTLFECWRSVFITVARSKCGGTNLAKKQNSMASMWTSGVELWAAKESRFILATNPTRSI